MPYNPLPIILTLVGGYFFIKLRGFFILHPLKTLKGAMCSMRHKGAFSSLTLALAGTLGVGNVFGVALGIIVGGAGSVFWLFLSCIFSAVIKYAEVVISRDNLTVGSGTEGGICRVIRNSFSRAGGAMTVIYAVCCLALSMVMGAALQCATVAESLSVGLGFKPAVTSFVLSVLVLFAIVGGGKIIARVTSVLIPVTTIIYIILTLTVIIVNAGRLPEVLGEIFSSAFNLRATGGGVLAFLLTGPVKEGYSRGILSNEAGAGTSSMAHGRSGIINPAAAGIMGIVEVFFDTALLCMLTAFAILLAVPSPGAFSGGMELVMSAFSEFGLPYRLLLMLSVLCFAYATSICWFYYGNECCRLLFGGRSLLFIPAFAASVFLGGVVSGGALVTVTDALMTVLTLITVVTLIKNSDRILVLSELGGVVAPRRNIKGILSLRVDKRQGRKAFPKARARSFRGLRR